MQHTVFKATHISHPAALQTWSGPHCHPILAHAHGKWGHTATYCSCSSKSLGKTEPLCFTLWQGISCAVPRETCISLPGPPGVL